MSDGSFLLKARFLASGFSSFPLHQKETIMATIQTPVLPFAQAQPGKKAAPDTIAADHSLLDIDRELDLLLDRMQDELEENGEASPESTERFQQFCEAFGEKVDRIGRFIRVMEARTTYCKGEAARLTARGKSAENKVDQTKALVMYYLQSRALTKMEGKQFTIRCQKNSQDIRTQMKVRSKPSKLYAW